jgi:hypothetical protein
LRIDITKVVDTPQEKNGSILQKVEGISASTRFHFQNFVLEPTGCFQISKAKRKKATGIDRYAL